MSAFLAKGAKSDLILRVDESVVACDAVKNDGDEPSVGGARRYRASIAPLALPGLLVETTALIRVEAIPEGVRYVTERCDNAFSGRFGRLVGSLPQPSIAVCTELRVRDQALVGRSESSTSELATPLDEGANSSSEEEAIEPASYWHYHVMMAMCSLYMAMLLTNWSSLPAEMVGLPSSQVEDVNMQSFWVKIVSQWICLLIYAWTLLAPYLMRNHRDFGIDFSDFD